MRKGIASALVAVTLAGSMTAGAAAAQGRYDNSYRNYDNSYRHYDNNYRRGSSNGSTAIIAGIAGLAIGAAIAGSNNNSRSYYGNGYSNGYSSYGYAQPRYSSYGYAQPYVNHGYGGGYQTCTSRSRVHDPYTGQTYVQVQRYAC